MRSRSRRSVNTPTDPTGSPRSMISAAETSTGTERAVLAEQVGAVALEPARAAVLARVDEPHDVRGHAGRVELPGVHPPTTSVAAKPVSRSAARLKRRILPVMSAEMMASTELSMTRSRNSLVFDQLGLGGAVGGDVAEAHEVAPSPRAGRC